ncbi:MAG: Gfo/Idh/MocA family oxidoreductase [Lentisphaerae bacterium]|nr:Gfo/Idh/MocA family oxidoreductase [Lentisphaerota bacterium]MBT4820691.1 Gfo/Idh/MocA family oxidoreductase [Lentisphaerota bacterium]MBT5610613.1 Gfo/Idh/MocA family oxidoreductase [Lentisphaerota bacterium]MBT7053860.1 Gfo/Idh/MocA family oxidoreductase [Lentisphaerota bacterium]MBT7847398.1 Gfo/Idh/MocA family oxidoreductase [Lentisphaerota bacterium]
MTTDIGYAVAGCGRIGRRHCQVIRDLPEARVVAVADPDAAKRESVQELVSGAPGYAEFGDILAEPRVDVVVICSPTHLHAQMTVDACRAGKHVYCEKAMAATPSQCRAMVKAAGEAGVKLTVGQSTRFQPAAMMARRMVETGAIGKPFGVSGSFAGVAEPRERGATDSWRYRAGSTGNGHVINFGCHYIDTARFVLAVVYCRLGP